MEKISMYKEAIYKEASRSWKSNIGRLSEESIEKLKSSGILNHKKELDGLNKGTLNIVKKLGGTIDDSRNNKKLRSVVEDIGKKSGDRKIYFEQKTGRPIKEKGLGSIIDKVRANRYNKGVTNAAVTLNRGFMSIEKNPITGFGKPIIGAGDIRKDIPKKFKKNLASGGASDVLGQISEKARKLKNNEADYINGILKRHEADELRDLRRSIKKGDYFKNTRTLNGISTTRYHSHTAPDVLYRESANVAVAPKNVKKLMTDMRNLGGETTSLGQLSGHKYGENGVFNKLEASKANKEMSSVNKNQVKQYNL